MKNVVIIAGLSASGKSTVLTEMVQKLGYEKLVTTTTRDPRAGEINGVDYHFLTKDEFSAKKDKGFFLENVEIKGNFYGVGLNAFEKDFGEKKPILILDPVGVVAATEKLKDVNWNVSSIFIDETPMTCINRVLSRPAKEEEQLNRIKDILTVEDGWGAHTEYSMRTRPGATISENANEIDLFNKQNMKIEKKVEKKPRRKLRQ